MKGICFKEPLFLLTVQGIKTQTRRIIKPQPEEYLALAEEGNYDNCDVSYTNKFTKADWIDDSCNFFRPSYKVGETVYLKEPYQHAVAFEDDGYGYFYGTENIEDFSKDFSWFKNRTEDDKNWIKGRIKHGEKKMNKLFMPEVAARYFIKITAVRAERLQDISDADCIKEGINGCDYGGMQCVVYGLEKGLFFDELGSTPTKAYAALIDSINGKGTWDNNPFVWVYDYELMKHY